jgi:large subunit ribosomal protein L15
MQTHNLKRDNQRKKKTIIGRGGKRGKTSGRGTKGQKARAGHKIRPEIRDIIMKLPKLRGYKFKSINVKPIVVSLADVDLAFSSGDKVNPTSLIEKGLVKKIHGQIPAIKILGDGEISKKLNLEGVALSESARKKLEASGSVITK